MTVYNINRGIGWASSGVEYAQAYRAKLFRNAGIAAKYVFTDFFYTENIAHFTRNIGFEDDEIIWLYSFFTDQKVEPSTYPLSALEEGFADTFEKEQTKGRRIRYLFHEKGYYMDAYLAKGTDDKIQRTELVSRGKLLRKDYYFAKKVYSEYSAPEDGKAKSYLRCFYHADGSVAYTEHIDGKDVFYRFPDRLIQGKEHLIAYMMELLCPAKEDVILLDRAKETGRAVFQHKNEAKLGVVIHAEHYNEGATDDYNVLWNNHYEYEFTNADRIDFFISSTQAQSDIFREQMLDYYDKKVRAVTIPVGALAELKRPKEARRQHALITASRLADEKHVDWLVKAVIRARKSVPDLTLDICGKGSMEQRLQSMIEEAEASDYIRLRGHLDLEDVYKEYEAYVSASTSEGFGLTLLEAVGSGLAMIGFDVRYGNVTFINHEKNGYLIPYQRGADTARAIDGLTEAIVRLFTEADLSAFSEESYRLAKGYLADRVQRKWEKLLLSPEKKGADA